MIKWFAADKLVHNLYKMNIKKFITKNSAHSTLHISYTEKYIERTQNTKFLYLQIYGHINWKNHTEETIYKLSGVCYAVRSMVHISNIYTLKLIYYTYFHSIIKYGIIFWSTSSNSGKIFTLHKKIITLMAGAQPRTSCRSLFKQLEILPVPYHNTLSLINLIINNHEIFQTNSSTQCINMKTKYHLLRPNANLSCFRKSTFYAGTKIFNSLPPRVTILKNDNTKLKASLRKYLNIQSFYSVDEFFTCKDVHFCELFVVFYTVNLYIYVLFHILLSL